MRKNSSLYDKVNTIFEGIDYTDEVLEYNIYTQNRSEAFTARRQDNGDVWWNASKPIANGTIAKIKNLASWVKWLKKGNDGYISLFREYLILFEQSIYEARYKMTIMQDLRDKYYKRGRRRSKVCYEMGFSISKAYYLYKMATIQYFFSNIHIFESMNIYNYLVTLYIHERQVRARLDFDLMLDYIHKYDDKVEKSEILKYGKTK